MLIGMFPGQGSQFPGMGGELLARYPRQCKQADDILGYSIAALCAGDDPRRMASTAFTQPAIFFVSCLAWLERNAGGAVMPSLLIGHSLGLYAALFAAQCFDLETGLRLVAKRGELMAAVEGGAMAAVMGDAVEHLPELLLEHQFHGLDIANYNSPQQAVISGKAEEIEAACKALVSHDLRCVRLPVSGAFHSRYMEPARLRYVAFLQHQALGCPGGQVISSTSGERLGAAHLLEEMSLQLVRPVRWAQSIAALRARNGEITFEEIGPGQVLTRLDAQQLTPLSGVHRQG